MSYDAFARYLNGEITKEELHALVDDTFNDPSDPVLNPTIDYDLVGSMKYVDMISGAGCSMVTERYLVLDATGRFSKSENSAGSTTHTSRQAQNTEYGHWTTKDNLLTLQLDNGETIEHHYIKYDDSVMLSGYLYKKT